MGDAELEEIGDEEVTERHVWLHDTIIPIACFPAPGADIRCSQAPRRVGCGRTRPTRAAQQHVSAGETGERRPG
jgi:hypothetical protein